jgi:hypothetical protein
MHVSHLLSLLRVHIQKRDMFAHVDCSVAICQVFSTLDYVVRAELYVCRHCIMCVYILSFIHTCIYIAMLPCVHVYHA